MHMSNKLNNYVIVNINFSTISGRSRTPSFGIEKKTSNANYSLFDRFDHYMITIIVLSFRCCEMCFIYDIFLP